VDIPVRKNKISIFMLPHFFFFIFQEPFQVKVASEALLIMDLVRILYCVYLVILFNRIVCHLFIQQRFTECFLYPEHIVLTEMFLRNVYLELPFLSYVRVRFPLKPAFSVGHVWPFIMFSLGVERN